MKKKLMLCVLPLLALASCGNNPQAFTPYVDQVNGIPTIHYAPTDHTTYLMLSKYGYVELDSVKTYGVDVPEKFYNYCVAITLDAGAELPVAKSDVQGATFRGWAFYNEDNENVWPDYYTTVPTTSGLALKAIFDGTYAGGGSGGGSGGGGSSSTLPTTGYGLLFSDGTYAAGTHVGVNMDGKDEYKCSAVNFKEGLTVQMYDFANQAGWIVDINPYSFGDTTGAGANTASHLTVSGSSWNVVSNFTADVYIQLKMNADSIYFELLA